MARGEPGRGLRYVPIVAGIVAGMLVLGLVAVLIHRPVPSLSAPASLDGLERATPARLDALGGLGREAEAVATTLARSGFKTGHYYSAVYGPGTLQASGDRHTGLMVVFAGDPATVKNAAQELAVSSVDQLRVVSSGGRNFDCAYDQSSSTDRCIVVRHQTVAEMVLFPVTKAASAAPYAGALYDSLP